MGGLFYKLQPRLTVFKTTTLLCQTMTSRCFLRPTKIFRITTTDGGGLTSANANGTSTSLLMSDSGQTHWFIFNAGTQPFSSTDHGSVPA